MSSARSIPITIVTGFLGSGKTTLILNLIPQLPPDYKLALLKNEFGDVAIDSELASSQAISGVQELLNGCICCNLVGQLSDALETLRNDVKPDRIIVETSGSAFPATLAMEINRLARETGHYVLDGVMSVIDVENWKGYEDTSMTAKVQAQYTDVLVLNKHELVSEVQLENCIDRILDLELDIPTPRVLSQKGRIDKDLIFGLDTKLANLDASVTKKLIGSDSHHDHEHSHENHQSEIEVLSASIHAPAESGVTVDLVGLEELLSEAPKDEVYRIKAIIRLGIIPQSSNGDKIYPPEGLPARYILNWAFGRWTFTALAEEADVAATFGLLTPAGSGSSTPAHNSAGEPILRMTIMTARGESSKWKRNIERDRLLTAAQGGSGHLTIERVS